MAVPMKNGGLPTYKVIIYVVLSGITTGIGVFIGNLIGNISNEVISMCLSFASGAMLYIVTDELLPEADKLYKGKLKLLAFIVGILIGLIVTKM